MRRRQRCQFRRLDPAGGRRHIDTRSDANPCADPGTNADADADTFPYTNAHSFSNADSRAITDAHADTVTDTVTHSYPDPDPDPDPNAYAPGILRAGAAARRLHHHAVGPAADPLGQRHHRVPPQLRRE